MANAIHRRDILKTASLAPAASLFAGALGLLAQPLELMKNSPLHPRLSLASCPVHKVVGCSVTLKCNTRRR